MNRLLLLVVLVSMFALSMERQVERVGFEPEPELRHILRPRNEEE